MTDIPVDVIAKARKCPEGFLPLYVEGKLWFYQPEPGEKLSWIIPAWRVPI